MSNLNTAYQPLVQSNQKKLNIPVDVNSEIPLELRWNDELTGAPEPLPNGGIFGGVSGFSISGC